MIKTHQALVKTIEVQVISILLVKGYIKLTDPYKGYSFSNATLTKKGLSAITKAKPVVTDEQVTEYRKLFPAGRRGPGKEPVRRNLQDFLSEHECTFKNILSAAKRYIDSLDNLTYCVSAHYFLYKTVAGTKTSKAEEYLEIVQEESNLEPDWRETFD